MGQKQGKFVAALFLLAATAMSFPCTAQPPPVLDTAGVPYLDASGRAAYARWLNYGVPRAFAVAPNRRFASAQGVSLGATGERVRTAALELCAARGGIGCALYAEDLNVVWQGRPRPQTPTPPGSLLSTWDYAFVPDPRFIWHRPQTALGVYVWGHGVGRNMDSRGLQPPTHVRMFNNAGFDVVRFDRHPTADLPLAASGWLLEGAAELRRLGYLRTVVGGQSRGGWTSLQAALRRPDLVDAVVATAPGAHGWTGIANLAAQVDDLRAMVRNAAAAPRLRVAYAQFRDDPFTADPDAQARILREELRPRVGALLLLDRPDGLDGHGAGATFAFADRYGPCLLRFVLDAAPPPACS